MVDITNFDASNFNPDEILGGILNPLSKEEINIDLPQPPVNHLPSNLVPQQAPATQPQADSILDSLFQDTINKSYAAKDPFQYTKERSYNADYDGANFERYYKTPRLFKKLGFSPTRNNEELYNSNASWFDYFKRSAGSALDLAATGFTDMLPWNAWDGKSRDIDAARQMERAHAIGADTRSGVGSFVNNLTVDSGYTFGILAEFAAEEIALWAGSTAVAPLTAGGSWVAALGKASADVAKVGKGIEKALDLANLYKSVDKAYDWMKSADKARDVYNAAKTGASWAAKQLVPNTVDWAKSAVKAGPQAFDLAKASKGFGAFYRDSRSISSVLSEASMEGGSTELQVRNDLIDEYFEKNGKMPEGAELENIYNLAANAGRETYLWNLPALYISNKIVFDRAFKGWKALAAFDEKLASSLAGDVVFKKAVKEAGEEAFQLVENNLKSKLKKLTSPATYTPKNLFKNVLKGSVLYAKENLAEGLQEVYQEATSQAMVDYYKDQMYHPSIDGSRSVWGAFADAAKQQAISGQMGEVFASGFLMGSLVQVPQKLAFEYIPQKFYQFTKPEEFSEYRKNQQENAKKLVTALNAAYSDKKFWDSIKVNAIHQIRSKQESEMANLAGDKASFYDIEDEAVFNHIDTIMQNGKIDSLREAFESMRDLTSDELQQAFGPVEKDKGDPTTYYNSKIDSILEKMDLITKVYEQTESDLRNPFDPKKYSVKNEPAKYKEERLKYEAFENAKRNIRFSNYSFARTLERQKSVLAELNKIKPVSESSSTDFNAITDKFSLQQEIELLSKEYKAYNLPEGDKKKAAQAEKKLTKLKSYKSALSEFESAQINFKKAVATNGDIEKSKSLLEDASDNLYKNYNNWIKYIGKTGNQIINQKAIDNSFALLKDLYNLDNEAKNMSQVVNILTNPKGFSQQFSRELDVIKLIEKNHINYLLESVKAYQKQMVDNELLQAIYNKGAFLEEDDIENVIKNREYPNKIFRVSDTNPSLIAPSDPIYKEVMDLVTKYFEATKPVEETAKEQPVTTTVPTSGYKLYPQTATVEELKAAGILKPLIDIVKDIAENNVEGDILKDKTDEEIVSTPFFKNIIKSNPASVEEIFEEYNVGKPEKPTAIESVEQIEVTSLEEVTKALENLKGKQFTVNPNNNNQYLDEAGAPFDRVSTLKSKGEDIDPRHAKRGNIIDRLLRDFISGKINTKENLKEAYQNDSEKSETWNFSDKFLNDLFSIFEDVKKVTQDNGLTLLSDVPTLWGTINGQNLAGTIDLLGIDKQGNVYIIDLKTSSRNRREDYSLPNSLYKEGDAIQQSAYAELIRQRTGITVKGIFIFPVQTKLTNDVYVSAESNKTSEGKMTISITPDRTLFKEISTPAKQAAPSTVSSDIEAKKAEIERRIQEVENFVNQDFFANSELLSKHWKTKKDLFENKVKQLKDLLQKGIKTGKDLRTLTNLLNDIRGVLNEGVNINNKDNVETNEKNIQKLAHSLFTMISDDVIKDYINEMNSVMETRFGKDAVSQQLVQYTTGEWTLDGKNVEYFLSKETLENAKNNKQINAKYDAELTALDSKKAEKPVINIYWGSPESSTNTRVLSNLAPRKFTYQGKEYGSVEHAYQTLKSGSFDQVTYDKYVKAGGYGTKIRGKAVQKDFDNLQLMRDLVVESFKQNPEQAKLLLNYSDFTHTTNEVTDKAFLDGIRLAQKNAELAALEVEGKEVIEEVKEADIVKRNILPLSLEELNNVEIERAGVKGKIIIASPDKIFFETENILYELEGATIYSNPSDFGLEGLPIDYIQTDNKENIILNPETLKKSKYNISSITENFVIVNNVSYAINLDSKGNIESLSPSNKPEQKIYNKKLIISVEIERNKLDRPKENSDTINSIVEISKKENLSTRLLNSIYEENFTDTISEGLDKLYSGLPMTDQEKLQVELWAFDALDKILSLLDDKKYKNNIEINNASKNLRIIINILHEEQSIKEKQAADKQTVASKSTQKGKGKISKTSSEKQSERIKPSTTLVKRVEISSNVKGLAAALTNPTELAKSKGNLTQSYPVEFRGKTYKDAEAAYQALKNTATKDNGPNSTYNLMVAIIKAKLEQHTRLVEEIDKLGGSKWIMSATHQPTNKNTVWETGGKNWFIKALNDAYISIKNKTSQIELQEENSTDSYLSQVFETESFTELDSILKNAQDQYDINKDIDIDIIKEQVQTRKEELAENPSIKNLETGDVVLLSNNTIGIVTKATKSYLEVKPEGADSLRIDSSQFTNNRDLTKIFVKKKKVPGVDFSILAEKMDRESKQNSAENIQNAQDINTPEQIEKDKEEAKKLSKEERLKRFKDNLGCK